MDRAKVFQSILGRIICHGHSCEECHDIFGTECCVEEMASYDEQTELTKEIWEQFAHRDSYDLKSIKEFSIEELIKLVW